MASSPYMSVATNSSSAKNMSVAPKPVVATPLPSGPMSKAPNMSLAPNMSIAPNMSMPYSPSPVIVSTSKPADTHINNLNNNIKSQVNAVNTQASNKAALDAAKAQVAALSATNTGLNPQGLTPQQMGQLAEDQMKQRVVGAAQAAPGTLQVGGQLGSLQTGTGSTPVNFQAYTNTPDPNRDANIQEVMRLNGISQEEATQRYNNAKAAEQGVNLPPGVAYNPATGQAYDVKTGNQYLGSTGPNFEGARFADSQATGVQGMQGQSGATPGGFSGSTGSTGGSMSGGQMSPDDQLMSLNSQTDQAYAEYTSKVESIKNGTFPLNPSQQATISSIMSNFNSLKQAQTQANQNYTTAIKQAGLTSGRARYAPEINAGNVQQAINVGIQKLSKIDAEASQALVQAQTAFQKEDYEEATKSYEMLQTHLDRKTDQLQKMMDLSQKAAEAAQKQEMEMMKYKDEQEQQGLMNTLKFAEFDQKTSQQAFDNIMSSNKFDFDQKKEAFDQMITSDKFDYQQKQDMIQNVLDQNKFALDKNKFSYEQEKDLRSYQLDLEKMQQVDTPSSYKEYELAAQGGYPGSYSEFLGKKTNGETALTFEQKSSLSGSPEVKQLTAMASLKDKLNAYRELADKATGFGLTGAEKAKAEAAYAALQVDWKTVAGLGVLSGSDMDLIERAIKPITGGYMDKLKYEVGGGKTGVINSIDTALGSLDTGANRQSDLLKARLGDAQYDPYAQAIFSPFQKPKFTNIDDLDDKATPEQQAQLDSMLSAGESQQDILNFFNGEDKPAGKTSVPSMTRKGSQSRSNSGQELGKLSAKYESSGNPGAIGYDNTGGYSYGTYQLAHNNAQRFVNSSPYASQFKGITFNSPAFRNKWKEIANKDPQGFKNAQQDYIEKTHYDPQAKKLASMGVDLNKYSPVLKDVIFSTAIQHGPANNIVASAIKSAGKNASEEAIIKKIYQDRWGGGSRFSSSTADVKKGVYNRFFGKGGELNTALKQLKQYA